MTRNARKFAAITALIHRGATEGERTAARNAARRLIASKGLKACLPSHPANSICGFSDELLDVARVVHAGQADMVDRIAFYAVLPSFGAKEIGRALAQIRSDLQAGWNNKGVWASDKDLRFLNVAEWGFEQAFYAVASVDGFTRTEADTFVNARIAA